MIYDKADEVTQKRFESFFIDINLLLKQHWTVVIWSLIVILLYYKCNKTNLNLGGSYIGSLKWIKNKKSNNKSY